MVGKSIGSATAHRRLTAVAGTSLAVAALAVAVAAEAPARADEPNVRRAFTQAFAPFALTETETRLAPETLTAAQARFDQAPVAGEQGFETPRIIGSGKASYYGAGFNGRRTASGERFNPSELTAAHRTLPFGIRVKVTNQSNGRSVVVRINDRGPFHHSRVIDLSHEAASQIGIVRQGHGQVEIAAAS